MYVRVPQESLEVSESLLWFLRVSKSLSAFLWNICNSLRVSQESFEVSQSLSKSLKVSLKFFGIYQSLSESLKKIKRL